MVVWSSGGVGFLSDREDGGAGRGRSRATWDIGGVIRHGPGKGCRVSG